MKNKIKRFHWREEKKEPLKISNRGTTERKMFPGPSKTKTNGQRPPEQMTKKKTGKGE